MTDEAVHSLALRERGDYRLLRRMGLDRWGARFPFTAPGLSQSAFFEAVVTRLDPSLALPEPDAPGAALNDRLLLHERVSGGCYEMSRLPDSGMAKDAPAAPPAS